MTLKQIVVDFDKCLAIGNSKLNKEGYLSYKPNIQLIERLIRLEELGYSFILCSARGYKRSNGNFHQVAQDVYKEIYSWLTKYNLLSMFKQICLGKKHYADCYIDDKAMHMQQLMDAPLGMCPEDLLAFYESNHCRQAFANWLHAEHGYSTELDQNKKEHDA